MAGYNEALIAILKSHEYPHADVKDRCAVYIMMDEEESGVFLDLDQNPVFAEDVYEAALAGRLKLITSEDEGVSILNLNIAIDPNGRIGVKVSPSDIPVWIEKRDTDDLVTD